MILEIAEHELETEYGTFALSGFIFGDNQQVVFALNHHRTSPPPKEALLLRIQYGCVNGTAFKAVDCDCGLQIDSALKRISEHGRGVFIYFVDHEAFGLGLINKMRIVAMEKKKQQSFSDIIKSHNYPPLASDVLWTVPFIFDALRLKKDVVLLGTNYEKMERLQQLGFSIARREDIVIDEARLSPDAIRDVNEKKSIFAKMSSTLRRLNFGRSPENGKM